MILQKGCGLKGCYMQEKTSLRDLQKEVFQMR